MNINQFFSKYINRQKWFIPTGFCLTLLLTAAAITLCILRGFGDIDSMWTFSIGADMCGLCVCSVLTFSCFFGRDGRSEYTKTFVSLLVVCGIQLFLDMCAWLVEGVAALRVWNLIVNTMHYSNSAVLIYMFWLYCTNALDMESNLMKAANTLLNFLLIPTVIACLVNLVYPFYFSVDMSGTYQRIEERWIFSQVYLAVGLLIVIGGLILSKASVRKKLITASFIMIPLLNQILTQYRYGITTVYAAMLVSIVLIYGVLFADREKAMASTEKELTLATRIQESMLPNTFPAFPDRHEFDIYASMNPAREVGGDFYDYYLTDDNHLCLVMADVAGKGVPASLFMMASKILIKTQAMRGIDPCEVLQNVNNQICANNREEMFVTVWIGVLDLHTGIISCANAGHEYPVIRKKDGQYELLRDKHGFVVGGMAGVKYKQYEIQLEPGSQIFLYTDGLTEATNAAKELFGTDRMVEALNRAGECTPEDVLKHMTEEVDEFVGAAPQFDDLTMMCVEYKGGLD